MGGTIDSREGGDKPAGAIDTAIQSARS